MNISWMRTIQLLDSLVFSQTIEQGELAMQRLSSKPGFCDLVDGFTLGPMVVDLLYWDGGFISFDELDARYAQQKTAE